MTLGEKIKCLRVNQRLSQESLAKQLKINRNQLSRIETGISEPSATTLRKIAIIFNISLDSLLELPTNNTKSTDDKLKLINEKCKNLVDNDLDLIIRLITILKSEYVKNIKNER